MRTLNKTLEYTNNKNRVCLKVLFEQLAEPLEVSE